MLLFIYEIFTTLILHFISYPYLVLEYIINGEPIPDSIVHYVVANDYAAYIKIGMTTSIVGSVIEHVAIIYSINRLRFYINKNAIR